MSTNLRLQKILIAACTLLAVSSCGNDSNAPEDGAILVTPASQDFAVGPVAGCTGVGAGGLEDFTEYTITIIDTNGNRLGNVDFNIQVNWAANSWTGIEVMRIYDDQVLGNNNGIAEAGEEVTSLGFPVAFDTSTRPDGTRKLIVQRDLTTGCTYKGSFIITSGSLVVLSEFENTES